MAATRVCRPRTVGNPVEDALDHTSCSPPRAIGRRCHLDRVRAAQAIAGPTTAATLRHRRGSLPVDAIKQILGARGSVSAGVLSVSLDRTDIGPVKGPLGVTFPPAFEISGDLTFQPLGADVTFFNGGLALKPRELNPVIDAIQSGGLVFSSDAQHYFDLDPMVWFIHLRGIGRPHTLAKASRRVLAATATPLPQKPPSNPATPLDHARRQPSTHSCTSRT